MKEIYIIASNTVRELIRDRIMYGILVFAVLLILLSLVSAQLSYIERTRITMDLGFAGIEISMVILSIFLGGTVVFREIEKRTVLTLLTRPIDRWQFLVGKYIGLAALVLILLLALSILFLITLLIMEWEFTSKYIQVVLGLGMEASVLIAITMVLGVVVRPTLSISVAIGVFLIGKSMSSLVFFMTKPELIFYKYFANVLRFTFPNFSRFDWKSTLLTEEVLMFSDVGLSFVYCISWVVMLVCLATILFGEKDIG